jgi:hypothetical protein
VAVTEEVVRSWTVVYYVASLLVGVVGLILLIRYVNATNRIAEEALEQRKAIQGQLDVTRQALDAQLLPLLVIRGVDPPTTLGRPGSTVTGFFTLKNIGPGPATNVRVQGDPDGERTWEEKRGGILITPLAPGEEIKPQPTRLAGRGSLVVQYESLNGRRFLSSAIWLPPNIAGDCKTLELDRTESTMAPVSPERAP